MTPSRPTREARLSDREVRYYLDTDAVGITPRMIARDLLACRRALRKIVNYIDQRGDSMTALDIACKALGRKQP